MFFYRCLNYSLSSLSSNVSLALEPSASPRPFSKRDERLVPAFTTPLPAASSPRPQSQPKTFMTEPEETKISLVAKPEPVVEQREATPVQEPSPVPPTPPAPAQTSNDILDDLLGLNTKKEKGTDSNFKRKLSFKFLRRYKV